MQELTPFLMPYGETVISENTVREFLDHWITPSVGAFQSPLEALFLVDLYLSSPALPSVERKRSFALNEVIFTLVEEELVAQRKKLNISSIIAQTSTEALLHIQQDSINSQLLLEWSLLYHCYCRRDLNITFDDFSNQIGVVQRSFRRYRASAIRTLTHTLIKREYQARQNHLTRLLLAELPMLTRHKKIFGRDAQLNNMLNLISQKTNAKILICGGVGVGKTTLTVHAIEKLIKHEALDYVIWVNSPKNTSEIFNAILCKLHIHSPQNLKGWLSLYRIALIIDNADLLIDEIDTLCQDLMNALVIFICNRQVYTRFVDSLVVLEELNKQDALRLTEYLSRHLVLSHKADIENYIDWIFDQVGGNPSAIILLLQNMAYSRNYWDGLSGLLKVICNNISPLARDLWIITSLWGGGNTQPDLLCQLLPICTHNVWKELLQHFVCYEQDDKVILHSVANTYIQSVFQDLNQTLETYLEQLTLNILKAPAYAVELIYNMTKQGVIDKQSIYHEIWIDKLAKCEQELKENWYWVTYIEFVEVNTDQRWLCRSKIHRSRYEWEDAEACVQIILEREDSTLYPEACLEKAKILRYRGYYSKALSLLQTIHKSQTLTDEIRNEIIFEQTVIYLDLRDGETALKRLSKAKPLPSQQTRYQFLLVNVWLELNRVNDCLTYLQSLIETVNDRKTLGIVYDLLGRSNTRLGDYHSSVKYFELAIDCYDKRNALAYARTLSNLGAAYLHQKNLPMAKKCLQQASEIQSAIQDVLGLIVTEKNLLLLYDT